MIIHLADSSKDRCQYGALVDAKKTEHLVSYAYKNNHEFEKAWNDQTEEMRIYLAEIRQNKELNNLTKPEIDAQLESWASREHIDIDRNKLPRILIDSGAFTAFTTGKTIRVEDYAEWAIAFKAKWEPLVRSLYFFNLDVIGDECASDVNLHRLEKLGLNPLPIFTFGGDQKYIKKYLEKYPYIGFGGLVGKSTAEQQKWLDYCFKFVIAQYKQTNVMPRIHLLGVTKEEVLSRYPVYSCDSSSWVSCLRFGGGGAIGKKKIPRYKESPEALKITIATLKAEIRKFQKMERDVTRLWASRGITWDD